MHRRLPAAKLLEFFRPMGVLLTSLLLLLTAGILMVVRVLRPRFRFHWLIVLAATAAAVLSTLLTRPLLPISLGFPLWRSAVSASSFATFTVSTTTWPYILGLASLAFGLLLAAPGRLRFPVPATWISCLALAGLGVLAIAADGPLTLVLFWAAIDLAEAATFMTTAEKPESGDWVSSAFLLKLCSTGLVLLAMVLGSVDAPGASFVEITSLRALQLLQIAALVRLFALGLPRSQSLEAHGPGDLETMLALTSGAAALGFLSQLRPQASNGFLILALSAGTALYAGWMFLRAPDRHSARPFWILGLGGLAVAAAVRGNPIGATGWGCSMLLAGGALYTAYGDDSGARRVPLVGFWLASALPFSITGYGWVGDGASGVWSLPFLVISQAFLLAGFWHWALHRPGEFSSSSPSGALKGITYAGFLWPIIVGLLLGFWGWPGALQLGLPAVGMAGALMAAGLIWAKQRFPALNPTPLDWLPAIFTAAARVGRREAIRLEASLQHLSDMLTKTFEGEAGIMWGLLFLVLFISLVARSAK